ncbi:mechanosensitive ion channel family protein [Corallococcus praedator]|uniref:Mechanosensitive ion channel family protein n=1 Tax=Corallococcus praedator TaxID=2316724 RepID=A0ABX9QQF6_9BACT|nr:MULTISPECIES: mechanosensitive ion channel family protein [Corallococcus]RKH17178.1 mechanosensitive ion channel family protein [Corallococcus sp. CA047B]RKH36381.1 mechanosensitive ion channel family protein [Corallococcus sp. CA031C]RKI16597.1 mechanosensitive ion channel family protein [Corallococcus praedator]
MDAIVEQLKSLALTEALPLLLKVIGALIIWFVGRTVISGFRKVLDMALQRRQLDATLIRYIGSLFTGALTMMLMVGILGLMGVETTSFAALIAAAGIAIGAAWSGLLANFAAGVFLLVLRPFRVGEEICAGGVVGIVQEIGLFVTTLDTSDNVRISVGNNQMFSDNIINYSHHPHRKMTVKVPLVHSADARTLMQALTDRMASVPGVQAKPAPQVEVAEFTLHGPVLAVCIFCKPTEFNDTQANVGEAVVEILQLANYGASVPAPSLAAEPPAVSKAG